MARRVSAQLGARTNSVAEDSEIVGIVAGPMASWIGMTLLFRSVVAMEMARRRLRRRWRCKARRLLRRDLSFDVRPRPNGLPSDKAYAQNDRRHDRGDSPGADLMAAQGSRLRPRLRATAERIGRGRNGTQIFRQSGIRGLETGVLDREKLLGKDDQVNVTRHQRRETAPNSRKKSEDRSLQHPPLRNDPLWIDRIA
jgi:hypothetical protein